MTHSLGTTLDQLSPESANRILCLGRSGTGKTGSLASLANAGFHLRIFDFDKGYAPLFHHVRRECHANIEIMSFSDDLVLRGRALVSRGNRGPQAFVSLMDALDTWHGGIDTWPGHVVAVFDSLTAMGQSALRHAQYMAGTEGKDTSQPTWGVAISNLERLLDQWKYGGLRCSILCLTHVEYLATEDNDSSIVGMPTALGKKLPTKVGQYFNTQLYYRMEGQGDKTTRRIFTTPRDGVATKCPVPVDPSYPLESGLSTIFSLMGITPTGPTKEPTSAPITTLNPSDTNPV